MLWKLSSLKPASGRMVLQGRISVKHGGGRRRWHETSGNVLGLTYFDEISSCLMAVDGFRCSEYLLMLV
jgi:hypothetical protein